MPDFISKFSPAYAPASEPFQESGASGFSSPQLEAGFDPAAAPVATQGQPRSLWRDAPRISAAQAKASRMIGRGLRFELCQANAELLVRPAHESAPAGQPGAAPLLLTTAAGEVEIEGGERLLLGLTGIDLAAVPHHGGRWPDWLAAALAGRMPSTPFESLTAVRRAPDGHNAGGVRLRLSLRQPGHAVHVAACASADTWVSLLASGSREALRTPWADWMPLIVHAPVLLGRHTLPLSAFRMLDAGDIILPDSPRFVADGSGSLNLGGRRWRVRYQSHQLLQILAEENSLETETTDAMPTGDEIAAMQTDAPEQGGMPALAEIPLTLHFEVGRLSLSLDQIRALGPQSILALKGASPQSIAIICGGSHVGRGEAVDIDGQLGIRITHWSRAC